ncbi:hypothetical protein ACFE04_007020 [Oxalis oulophora]
MSAIISARLLLMKKTILPPPASLTSYNIRFLSYVPPRVRDFPRRPPIIPTPSELTDLDREPLRRPDHIDDNDFPKPFSDTPPLKPSDTPDDVVPPPRKKDDVLTPLSPPDIPPTPDGPQVVF